MAVLEASEWKGKRKIIIISGSRQSKLWETPGVSNRTQTNTDHSIANLNQT